MGWGRDLGGLGGLSLLPRSPFYIHREEYIGVGVKNLSTGALILL